MFNEKLLLRIVGSLLSHLRYKNSKITLDELKAKVACSESEFQEVFEKNKEYIIIENDSIKLLKKFASQSHRDPYLCQMNWDEDTFVQCGGSGIVIAKEGKSYKTSFFEAFPLNTFLRGEGSCIELAELDAWAQYNRILACDKHEFERRGRTDDYGSCKHCNYTTSGVLPILTNCAVCNIPAKDHSIVKENKEYYCEDHYYELNWEKDIAPTIKHEFQSCIFKPMFEAEQYVRRWIKENKTQLTKSQQSFLTTLFNNAIELDVLPEHKEPLLKKLVDIVKLNPESVNCFSVYSELIKELQRLEYERSNSK